MIEPEIITVKQEVSERQLQHAMSAAMRNIRVEVLRRRREGPSELETQRSMQRVSQERMTKWKQHKERVSVIEEKVRRGEKLSITEWAFLGKYYPKETARMYEATQQIRESKTFYEILGYPEYAGKYAPFEIPEGYQVKTITETKEGLQIGFEEARKGIAETLITERPSLNLLSYVFRTPEERQLYDIMHPPETRVLGADVGIGIVAAGESIVYSVGRLAGFETPRIPPTVAGGLLGKGIGFFTGTESMELEETLSYGPAYGFGTVIGDVFGSMVIGEAVGVAAQKIKPIASKIYTKSGLRFSSKLYGLKQFQLKVLEKTPRVGFKGSRVEMWLIKHSEWYRAKATEQLGPQAVGLGYTKKTIVGGEWLKAERMATSLLETPKTAGVMIWKYPAEITKRVSYPHLFSRAGAVSIGYLGELGFQKVRHYDPFPQTVKEVTIQETVSRRDTMPFLPVFMPSKTMTRLPQLLSLGLTTGLKARVQPRITSFALDIQPILPKLYPKQKERQELKAVQVVFPFERGIIETVTREKQIVSPVVRQMEFTMTLPKQKQKQISFLHITPPRIVQISHPYPRPFLIGPPKRRKKRKEDLLFGRWFKREHPIPTVEFMRRSFGLSAPKKRKKKSKRRR